MQIKISPLYQNFAACVMEYFDAKLADAEDKSSEDPIYKGYKAVLDSKSVDETLVSFFLPFLPSQNKFQEQFVDAVVPNYQHGKPCRHYMLVGSRDTRDIVTNSHGSNM